MKNLTLSLVKLYMHQTRSDTIVVSKIRKHFTVGTMMRTITIMGMRNAATRGKMNYNNIMLELISKLAKLSHWGLQMNSRSGTVKVLCPHNMGCWFSEFGLKI